MLVLLVQSGSRILFCDSAHFSWWWLRWLTSSPSLISAAESGIRMSGFSPRLSSSTSRCHLRFTRLVNNAAKSAVQMRESANAFTKECFEKMFEHFISIVKTRYGFFEFLDAFTVHYDLIKLLTIIDILNWRLN